MSFLGIDLGTGGVRCIIVNEEGFVSSEVQRSLSRLNLSANPGESEQDANDWIHTLENALDELFSKPKNRHILAVAVDSTSGTVLPVDSDATPLGSALLHNDMRSINEAELCKDIFDGDCSPSFSLPKILWMNQHLCLPDEVRFLHATDFLNAWLCGSVDIPTDFTNAMKSGLDLQTKEWPETLVGMPLPPIVAPGEVIGQISRIHQNRWSLTGSCLLVSGATDSNAAFYASGAGKIGDWSTTIGTTLAVKGISSKRIFDPQGRIYCHRHPDGNWMPGGASNAGGEILKAEFGDRIEVLEKEISCNQVHSGLVYPSIRKGERLPFSDPHFLPFGNKGDFGPNEYFLGCIEGLAFVEKMTYELLEKLGAEVGNRIFATGGAVASKLGLQIRADVLQRSILVPQYPNSAMGAAILAAAGYYTKSVGDMSNDLVKVIKTVDPGCLSDERRNVRYTSFQKLCAEKTTIQ